MDTCPPSSGQGCDWMAVTLRACSKHSRTQHRSILERLNQGREGNSGCLPLLGLSTDLSEQTECSPGLVLLLPRYFPKPWGLQKAQ